MGGVKVGELYGVLRLDKSGFDSGLRSAGGMFKGLEGMALNVAKRLAQVAAAAAIAFPAYAVTQAMAFETAMLNVNSIAKVDTDTFNAMSDSVLRLSTELPQSAETLAKGLYDIQSSGFAGQQGLDVLEAAAKAASAGLTTTEVSAAGVTAILNAYGLGAESAAGVSDLMFKTVDRGVISFEELAGEIGKTTALSAPLGVSMEEVAAGIALMTRKGIDGANATTQLNAIMQNLLKPSNEAVELANELGLGWDSQALKAKGLVGVLADMMDKTGGNHEQMATLLGDARAIRGAFVLASDGGAEFNAELGEMQNAAGATDTALSYQKQGLAYNLQLVRNKMDVAAIGIGTKLMPKIAELATKVADWVTENEELIGQIGGALLSGLEIAATAIGKVAEGVKLVIEVIDFLKPGLLIVAGILATLAAGIIGSMVPALFAMGAAWVVAFGPVALAAAAAVAAIAGVSLAINTFAMDFGEMGDTLHKIEEETGASYDTVKELTRTFMEDMGLSFEDASARAREALTAMPEMTAEQMDATVAAVKSREEALGAAGAAGGQAVVDYSSEALRFGAGSIYDASSEMMDPLPEAVEEAQEEAVEIATATPGQIAGALMDEDQLTEAAEELKERILNPFSDTKRRAEIEAQLAAQWIKDGLRSEDTATQMATVEYVNGLLDQYELMAPGALAAGELVNPALAEGLGSNIQSAIDAAEDVASRSGAPLDISADANAFGYNSALAYADGIRKAEMEAYWASVAVAAAAARGIRAESPPTDPNSPLRRVIEFGYNTFDAYAEGIEKAGPRIQDAVRGALGAGADLLGGAAFPALAGEAGPTWATGAGMGGGSTSRVDVYLHDPDGAIAQGGYDQGSIERMLESALLGVASTTRHQSLRMSTN